MTTAPQYPGKRFGLPEKGPRSIARFGRRLGALVIDWAVALMISALAFASHPLATLGVFALTQIILVMAFGATIGHLIFRIRIVPITGGRLQWWRSIPRTVLLCLVVPVMITDADQRGIHDQVAGTLMVVV